MVHSILHLLIQVGSLLDTDWTPLHIQGVFVRVADAHLSMASSVCISLSVRVCLSEQIISDE